MNNELENLLIETQKNPYIAYGFLKNPFPTIATESYKICYNQEPVKKIFINKLRSFIRDQNIQTLLIDAEHRVGKTNFVRYYETKLKDLYANASGNIVKCVYIRTYGDDYLSVHKTLIEMLGESFFLDIFNKLKEKRAVLDEISDTDFRKGLLSCIKSPSLFGFDPTKATQFFDWFEGLKLTQKELKEIGVFSNITTSSLAIRYLKDLIKISRSLGVMNGIVIFMDEFELLFGASVNRAKRDKYLQDLRSLIDELQMGIFIVCATTPWALIEMSRNYQALKVRFGDSISLSPIRNVDEAQAYAKEYLDFARLEYQHRHKESKETKKFKTIIETTDIEKMYKELASSDLDDPTFLFEEETTAVKQGFFFEKLHNYVEEKIIKSS